MAHHAPMPCTAAEALVRLRAGNARFVSGEARFPTARREVLAALAQAQHPYATILGCSDSRVPPEILFDAGFGELFVVRLAGHAVGDEAAGSLQYAGVHLRTPLLLVLGHEGCGAVKAAVDRDVLGYTEALGMPALRERIARHYRDAYGVEVEPIRSDNPFAVDIFKASPATASGQTH